MQIHDINIMNIMKLMFHGDFHGTCGWHETCMNEADH